MPKIGFACKYIDNLTQVGGIKPTDDCKKYNTGTTTVAWLKRQPVKIVEEKLWSLIKQNLEATRLLVTRVSTFPEPLRMLRLTSDLLPVYTHPDYQYFYQLPLVNEFLIKHFDKIGTIAKNNNVRLSFHPGQFVVLASDRPDVVNNSIAEFEYHADMARMMGYGNTFQDMKINVHVSGKLGADGFRAAYTQLSTVAKNCITIENDEHVYGLDDCLKLADLCPITLDIHHHYVKTGEYLSSDDARINTIIDSWRGVVPVLHYSNSLETIWRKDFATTLPDYQVLLESGIKKQALRAHSDCYINPSLNDWAISFLDRFDIMCEAKAKNLASAQLYQHAIQAGYF